MTKSNRCDRLPPATQRGASPSTAGRLKSSIGAVLALYLAGLVICLAGCRGYPEVSPAAFELAKAVNNLCNLRDAEQIPTASAIIAQQHAAGEITDAEQELLTDILTLAAGGKWERAEADARRLLADQTEW